MQAHYKTRDGRLVIAVDAPNQKALFKELASAQDVFEAETQCGLCGCKELRFRCRTIDTYDYYELVCTGCNGVFSFGQLREGGRLFPKRRDEHGEILPNGGWCEPVAPKRAPQRQHPDEHHDAPNGAWRKVGDR